MIRTMRDLWSRRSGLLRTEPISVVPALREPAAIAKRREIMPTEIHYHRDFRGQPMRSVVWHTQVPNEEARFAMALVERFGLIAGKPDGEDSAGRAIINTLPVAETVARAFDLAGEAFRVMHERGLMLELLPYEEALDKAREESDRN
jgi:hypothetical protein